MCNEGDKKKRNESSKFIFFSFSKHTHTNNSSGKEFKITRYAPCKKHTKNITTNNSTFIVSPESEFYDSFNFYRFASFYFLSPCSSLFCSLILPHYHTNIHTHSRFCSLSPLICVCLYLSFFISFRSIHFLPLTVLGRPANKPRL